MANGSYEHVWKRRDEPDRNVFFPAPTYGIDANTTFTVRLISTVIYQILVQKSF